MLRRYAVVGNYLQAEKPVAADLVQVRLPRPLSLGG